MLAVAKELFPLRANPGGGSPKVSPLDPPRTASYYLLLCRLYLSTNSAQASELAVINSDFGRKTLRANPSPTTTYVLGTRSIKICGEGGFCTSSGPVAEMLLERKSEHSDLPRSVDLAFPRS
jgi:hypothetical protein